MLYNVALACNDCHHGDSLGPCCSVSFKHLRSSVTVTVLQGTCKQVKQRHHPPPTQPLRASDWCSVARMLVRPNQTHEVCVCFYRSPDPPKFVLLHDTATCPAAPGADETDDLPAPPLGSLRQSTPTHATACRTLCHTEPDWLWGV
jgi:hypothetical protein